MAQQFTLLQKKLKELRHAFTQQCRDDVPGLLAARTYAHQFIETLRKALSDDVVKMDGWALVAVGGFGRGELSFASDLDLLFLHQNRLSQAFQNLVRDLVYCLWDTGFEVGHTTSSISGVRQLSKEDFSVLTNYLEVELIAGNTDFYHSWRKDFMEAFGPQGKRRFLQNLLSYRKGRMEQYNESSYLLEPHLKEGVGGLRDLHAIRWAATVFVGAPSYDGLIEKEWISPQEKHWIEQACDFLWRVRLQLHTLAGRRQDQLLFADQEQLAARLGYQEGQQGSSVEAFMRHFYRQTARIRRTASFLLERLDESQKRMPRFRIRKSILPGPFLLEGKHLNFMEPEWLAKKPKLLMRFFWQAAQSDAHFHHQAGQIIRENLNAFDEECRRDPEIIKQFFEILLDPDQSFRILIVMLETGFLQTFIPEFQAIRYRVQNDVYHLYTVDEHLLRTVRILHQMERRRDNSLLDPGLNDIFVQLPNRRILYLAALLHDIGKGVGRNHAAKGAAMVKVVAERMGLSLEEADLISFLIENHLLLAETAQKRDLMDEKPISYCALEIQDQERLHMLYLLTIADSRATGPGAWSAWKASLLKELWSRVDRMLTRGEWKGEDLQRRAEETIREVIEKAETVPDTKDLERWLDRLSYRYLLSQSSDAIVEHYYMERELDGRTVVLRTAEAEGEMWELTVATRDRPGLFSLITGVLWVRGLNILSADIFTRESGVAMDILIVDKVPDPLNAGRLWDRVEADLVASLENRDYFEELIAAKRKPSLLQQRTGPRKEDIVLVDEDASDFYTIIEVYTWDRPGILYAMSNTLYRLNISIQLAKISTPGAQVADVFYVTDMGGGKLMDYELHQKVRDNLLECLAAVH